MNGQWQRYWTTLLAGLLSLLVVGGPGAALGDGGRTYRVQGKVVAISLQETSNVIVVKTPVTPKEEMTVGAVINQHTKIVRGRKRVTLQNIKIGEVVLLTYIKSRDGLFARTVQAR